MYEYDTLRFPKLYPTGEQAQVGKRSIPLYKLNWVLLDKKLEQHLRGAPTLLDDAGRDFLDESIYALTPETGASVQHWVDMAKAEWARTDLGIPEWMNLERRQLIAGMVSFLFTLLSDNLWDPDKDYIGGWMRKGVLLRAQLPLFRFWDCQCRNEEYHLFSAVELMKKPPDEPRLLSTWVHIVSTQTQRVHTMMTEKKPDNAALRETLATLATIGFQAMKTPGPPSNPAK